MSYHDKFNHIGELRNPKFTIADRVTFVLLMIVIIGFIGGSIRMNTRPLIAYRLARYYIKSGLPVGYALKQAWGNSK